MHRVVNVAWRNRVGWQKLMLLRNWLLIQYGDRGVGSFLAHLDEPLG
jgi:hypothetical protein